MNTFFFLSYINFGLIKPKKNHIKIPKNSSFFGCIKWDDPLIVGTVNYVALNIVNPRKIYLKIFEKHK